jgi:hypothetical protein
MKLSIRSILVIGVILSLSFSAGAGWLFKKDKDKDEAKAAAIQNQESTPLPYGATYLDTLNKGRELGLSEKDLAKSQIQVPQSSRVDTLAPQSSMKEIPNGYRIQCLVTSQIERARIEQKALESKVRFSIYILFMDPYYKIQVGDFTKREKAEEVLTTMKKDLGYPDAFIVSSKVFAGR